MAVLIMHLPDHLQSNQDIAAWLRENIQDLYPAMDLDVTDYDAHAMLDKVHIKNIEIVMTHVAVKYEYDYAIVNGCRDLNFSGTSKLNRVTGHIIG